MITLRIALAAIDLIFIFGVYPLTVVWPSGWRWGHGSSHYLILGSTPSTSKPGRRPRPSLKAIEYRASGGHE
jgi:hypothetical protein